MSRNPVQIGLTVVCICLIVLSSALLGSPVSTSAGDETLSNGVSVEPVADENAARGTSGTGASGGESNGTSDASNASDRESGTSTGSETGSTDGSTSEAARNGTESGGVAGGVLGERNRTQLGGSIDRLSSRTLFTVRAEQAAYWRVQSYGTYTGSGWQREPSDERPSPSDDVRGRHFGHRVTVHQEVSGDALPAAWRPLRVVEGRENAWVTEDAEVRSVSDVPENESYAVISRMNNPGPERLRQTGTDDPERIAAYYTRLPDDVPDRVRVHAAEITADAETRYDSAIAVQRWLERNKNYSLEMDRPQEDYVDTFLFEREEGYCQYFASSMVVMLRSQGIPARYVTGYSPGQPVEDDQYVVRGMNAHAWVEVYFPDEGWVQFDPTPPSDRLSSEREALNSARAANVEDVDVSESQGASYSHSENGNPDAFRESSSSTGNDSGRVADTGSNGSSGSGSTEGDGSAGEEGNSSETEGSDSETEGTEGESGTSDSDEEDGTEGSGDETGSEDSDGSEDDGSSTETAENSTDDGSGDDTTDSSDDTSENGTVEDDDEQTRRPYNVTVDGDGVPGAPVTVTVTQAGDPVDGITVLFNDEPVGTTNQSGMLTTELPYEREVIISIQRDRTSDAVDSALTAVPSVPFVGSAATRNHALEPPSSVNSQTKSSDDEEQNESVRLDVETDVTLSTEREPVPGERVVLQAQIREYRVPNANVSVNGRVVGRTNETGHVAVRMPYRDSVNVTIRRGDVEGSKTYSLPPLDLSIDGNGTAGTEAVVRTTVANYSVQNATVTVEGERVGRTDETGAFEFTIPYREAVNVTVEKGELAVNRTVDVGSNLTVATSGFVFPGQSITASATIDGRPVDGATVTAGGDTVGETNANGNASVGLPLRNTYEIRVQRGELRETATVSNVLVLPAMLGFGVFGLVGVAIANRRYGVGPSPVAATRGMIADSLRTVTSLLVGLVAVTARGLDRLGSALHRLSVDTVGVVRRMPGRLRNTGVRLLDGAKRRIQHGLSFSEHAVDVLWRRLVRLRELELADVLVSCRRLALAVVPLADDDDTAVSHSDDPAATVRSDSTACTDNGDEPPPTQRIDVREAWEEVLHHVRVRNPRAATTITYREAAIRRGLPPKPVRTLASLYREAEYSYEMPTTEEEHRAWQSIQAIRSSVEGGDGS